MPIPALATIFSGTLDTQRRKGSKLRILGASIPILIILLLSLNRMQKLFPPISLNSKQLLDGSYFACCIRIKVRSLESLNEVFYLFERLLNHRVFTLHFKRKNVWRFNSNRSVYIVIAIFDLFYERNDFFVADIKLPSHKYNLMACCKKGRLSNQSQDL